MSLPANWSTVTVTGTYLNVDGEPLKGTVAFSTSARVVDAAANVTVPPGVRQVSLDKDGKFSLVLPATDDPDVAPTGFVYRVDENLVLPSGVRSLATYLILLPAATPTVDLADVAPVTAVAEVSPYLRAADLGTAVETPAGAQAKASAAQAAALAAAGDAAVTEYRRAALRGGRRIRQVTAGNQSVTAQGVTVGSLSALTDSSVVTGATLGTATMTAATNIITTSAAHGLSVNDVVVFGTLTGAAGLTAGGDGWYVRQVPSATTFTVSSTQGGTERDITSDGSAVAVYRRLWAYDRANARVQPALQILGTRAVQATAVSPRFNNIRPDPTVINYGTGTSSVTPIAARVQYDGLHLDLILRNNGVGEKHVYVDGLFATTVTGTQLTAAGVTSGNYARLPVTFADARFRIVEVFERGAPEFVGYNIDGGSLAVYPASSLKGPRVVVSGDSFTEGTGVSAGHGWVRWLSWHMGWPDVWQCGLGGTGYSTANGGRPALVGRYSNDLVANAPNVAIIAMGLNDAAAWLADGGVTVTADATAVLDGTIAGLPDAEIIVVGPWPNGTAAASGSAADLTNGLPQIDAALRTLCAARGLRYISPCGEGWTYTLFDSTHPNDGGHATIGWRVAGHLLTPYPLA